MARILASTGCRREARRRRRLAHPRRQHRPLRRADRDGGEPARQLPGHGPAAGALRRGGLRIARRRRDRCAAARRAHRWSAGARRAVSGAKRAVRGRDATRPACAARGSFSTIPALPARCMLVFAAALAEGTTTLVNAASEPEIMSVIEMLKRMGAKIRSPAAACVEIEGVQRFRRAPPGDPGPPRDGPVRPRRRRHPRRRDDRGRGAAAPRRPDWRRCARPASSSKRARTRCASAALARPRQGPGAGRALSRPRHGPSSAARRLPDPVPGRQHHPRARLREPLAVHKRIAQDGCRRDHGGPNCDHQRTHTALRYSCQGAGRASRRSLVLAGLVAEGRTEIGDLYHLDRAHEDLVQKLQAPRAHESNVAKEFQGN